MFVINRRYFITALGGGALGLMAGNPLIKFVAAAGKNNGIQAVAFDAFPVFDPRSVFVRVKTLFPERGDALAKLWFTKIFGYTWLRTLGNRYKTFPEIIGDALLFSAASLKCDLTAEKKKQLTDAWRELDVWEDVKPALRHLRQNNIRLGFLSNMTEDMLRVNAARAEIEDLFDFYLSTDYVRKFKPAPEAYNMGMKAFGMPKENIAFAAFAGWDAAGADWFGYPTIWVNRLNQRAENLGKQSFETGRDMSSLLRFVGLSENK